MQNILKSLFIKKMFQKHIRLATIAWYMYLYFILYIHTYYKSVLGEKRREQWIKIKEFY